MRDFETGVVDLVLPLDDIAPRLVALAHINDAPLSDAFARTDDTHRDILVRLVDDLLDVSRIARGKIQLATEPVDAARVVESALEAVRSLIDEAGHSVHVELPSPPATIVGDYTRLTQIAASDSANKGSTFVVELPLANGG